MPLWLARKAADVELDVDLGDELGETSGRLQRHPPRATSRRPGRGVLVEVEEDDGEQVLVWLR